MSWTWDWLVIFYQKHLNPYLNHTILVKTKMRILVWKTEEGLVKNIILQNIWYCSFSKFNYKEENIILRASMHLRNEYPMWENTRKLRWKMIGAALGWSFGCNLFTFVLPAPPLVQLVEPKVIQLIQTLSCVRSIYSPSYFLTQIEFPILLKWGLGCNCFPFFSVRSLFCIFVVPSCAGGVARIKVIQLIQTPPRLQQHSQEDSIHNTCDINLRMKTMFIICTSYIR